MADENIQDKMVFIPKGHLVASQSTALFCAGSSILVPMWKEERKGEKWKLQELSLVGRLDRHRKT